MKYFLFSFLFLSAELSAQNPGPVLGAMGSGGAAVTGIWSLQQNPAGIASLKQAQIGIAYERRFLDEDLSTQTAVLAIPFKRGVIGAAIDRYGFSEYNELQAGFFYAKSFGDSFSMALGARYHQLSINNYGTARGYTVEAGFQLKLSRTLTIGSHLSNPNQSRYSNTSELSLPVKLSFGAAFEISDKILLVIDVRKLLTDPLDVLTGMEYSIGHWVYLRGGISANPFKQYAGFGITHKKIHLDASVMSHTVLGYSPQVALGYEF